MSSCPAISVSKSNASLWWEPVARGSKSLVLTLVSQVWLLFVCKVIIGMVSAFDTYLTMKYVVSLETYEQNPVGRWLMGLDTGPVSDTQQIAAFITAKFLGTIIVLLVIQGIAFWRVPLAGVVAIAVAAFQLSLVAHLLFGIG